MRFMRNLILGLLFAACFSKIYTFYIEKQLKNVKFEIKKCLKEINLLKIEWTYLNQHMRLRVLAQELLPDWRMIEGSQFGDFRKEKSK